MFLEESKQKLDELFNKDFKISVNETIFPESKDYIYDNILKKSFRFIRQNNLQSVRISFQMDDIFVGSFNLCEYPNCCGKVILYEFYFSNRKNHISDPIVNMTDEEYNGVVKIALTLAENIAKKARYSTMDFIISEFEQAKLFNSITTLQIKPINTFINKRQFVPHTCHLYSKFIQL